MISSPGIFKGSTPRHHVAWEKEHIVSICSRLGYEATLWLLALAEKKNVGTGKAANYKTYPGKIESYAKEKDITSPERNKIRAGFKKLKRAQIETPDGARNTIIEGDKPEYVKLTPIGQSLVTTIGTEPDIRKAIKSSIGVEVENKDKDKSWWPEEVDPDGAEIRMKAISDEPDGRISAEELETIAEFECEKCGEAIENEYTFVYPDEAWSKDQYLAKPVS